MSSGDEKKSQALDDACDFATEMQPEEAVKASGKRSIPIDAKQNSTAPRVRGYILTAEEGEGGYGKVWRGWQESTSKEVAVKVFSRRSGSDWIFLQREVERLAKLDNHANVITLLDANLSADPPFYVMDMMTGGSLDDAVVDGKGVPTQQAISWIEQICSSLHYVHGKGLIHCDLKPANVLLDERDTIRLADFGQSRVFTESAASLGTLFYMAPEQAIPLEPGRIVQPDVRWDIYALGATAMALLTGHAPHATPDNRQRVADAADLGERLDVYRDIVRSQTIPSILRAGDQPVDYELTAIILKCLSANPDDRYDSVSAVMEDLKAWRTKRPVSPLRGNASYRAKKFLQRNPFIIVLTLAAIITTVGLVQSFMKQRELDRNHAGDILAAISTDPADGLARLDSADSGVQKFFPNLAQRYVTSSAHVERILGSLAAPWINPDSFWASVQDGALWQNGEWLELCTARWPQPQRLLDMLQVRTMAVDGSPRQQYVALCLIGQLGQGEQWRNICETAAKKESNPGVQSAAMWAAQRLGQKLQLHNNDNFTKDDLADAYFVKLPAVTSFRPGSDKDEAGRWSDEDRANLGEDIRSMWLATTETTIAQFQRFWDYPQRKKLSADNEQKLRDSIQAQLTAYPSVDAANMAVEGMSPIIAFRYCEWLTKQSQAAGSYVSYRLPTEAEWEYACRGGNSGAYCYGNDRRYLELFAVHNGQEGITMQTSLRMPNYYGLFDMHGNMWEICSTPYREKYSDSPLIGEAPNGIVRRGGAIYSPAERCRSAQRNFMPAEALATETTFRIVRVEGATP